MTRRTHERGGTATGSSRQGGRRGEIYAKLQDLRDRYADLIRERYPKIPRRVSGYNLDRTAAGERFPRCPGAGRHARGPASRCSRPRATGRQPAECDRCWSSATRTSIRPGDHVVEDHGVTGRSAWKGSIDGLVDYMQKKGMHPGGRRHAAQGRRLAARRVRRREQGGGRRQGATADGAS